MRDAKRPGPGSFRARASLASSLIVALLLVARSSTPTAGASAPQQSGRDMFVGQTRFQNGGPPCAACHSISSLPFPNGGVLGPDLSGIYQTLGPEGTDVALQTLFFPTMMPLYEKRPLTPGEQQALKSFFQQAGSAPAGPPYTLWLAGLSLAGFVVLVALTWLAWRNRLIGVRAPLVERTGGART